MKQALHIKNLTKKYKDFTLDHISLDLPYGMILGLIGENGSGKSTLINSILNIVKADYDEVHILGQDLKSQEKEIKKEIAVIFNDSHYGENLTPLFIGKMLSGIYTDWDQKKFTDYLKQFHLPEKKRLKTFSTGMKVKLEFAAALSHNPKLLILDEATNGLDPVFREEILEILREFTEQEDHSVLISSHIVSYLAAVLFLFLLIEAMQTGDLFSLKYFFMLITAFVFPLLGCSSIESSLEQDEKVNFDKIQLTFPITKTEIVLSKYILGICFLTICNVFSLIFVFSFTSSHNKITLQEGLSAWGFGVLFSLVFFAVVNFAFFLLGRKLGLIVYIFIAMLFGGIYGAVSSLKGMEFLMAGDKTMIFIIGIPIGILFVVISFFLSLACYKKRYS